MSDEMTLMAEALERIVILAFEDGMTTFDVCQIVYAARKEHDRREKHTRKRRERVESQAAAALVEVRGLGEPEFPQVRPPAVDQVREVQAA